MSPKLSSKVTLPVDIGPWPLGLNNRDSTYSPRDIKDQELVTCSNFDIKENGVLLSRSGLCTYNPDIFQNIIGDGVAVTLRNILGKVRIVATTDEGLVQVVDTINRNVYLLRTALADGEKSDFPSGYWAKLNYAAGANFYFTSATRYFNDIYLTTNPSLLNEGSTFAGGYRWDLAAASPPVVVSSTFTPVNPVAGLQWVRDVTDNIFAVFPGTQGSANGKIQKITSGGVVTDFKTGIESPKYITCNTATGDLYVSCLSATDDFGPILKITSAGVQTTFVVADAGKIKAYKGIVWKGSTSELFAIEENPDDGSVFSNPPYYPTNLIKFSSVGVRTLIIALIPQSAAGSNSRYVANLVIDAFNNINTILINSSFHPITISYASVVSYSSTTGSLQWSMAEAHTLYSSSLTGLGTRYNLDMDSAGNRYVFSSTGVQKIDISSTVTPIVLESSGWGGSNSLALLIYSTGFVAFYDTVTGKIMKFQFSSVATWTNITTIPFGDTSFILKDRMFVVNKTTNRIYYSKATDPTLWDTPNDGGFFDVAPGDGLTITDIAISNDQLFIFKESKTFVFAFTADPGTDGALRIMSVDRGAYSAVTFNNIIYLVGSQGIQKILNGYFVDISQSVKALHSTISSASTISQNDNRLLVSVNNANNILVMNLFTGVWSSYNLFDGTNQLVVLSHMFSVGISRLFFLCSSGSSLVIGGLGTRYNTDNLVLNAGTTYSLPQYQVVTKVQDYGAPLIWKRMMKFVLDLACGYDSFYVGPNPYDIPVYAHFSSSSVDSTSEIDTRAGGTDDLNRYPIQKLTIDGVSSFRFQTVYFELLAPAIAVSADVAGGPLQGPGKTLVQGAPRFTVKKFSGFIMMKVSKGEGISSAN